MGLNREDAQGTLVWPFRRRVLEPRLGLSNHIAQGIRAEDKHIVGELYYLRANIQIVECRWLLWSLLLRQSSP